MESTFRASIYNPVARKAIVIFVIGLGLLKVLPARPLRRQDAPYFFAPLGGRPAAADVGRLEAVQKHSWSYVHAASAVVFHRPFHLLFWFVT